MKIRILHAFGVGAALMVAGAAGASVQHNPHHAPQRASEPVGNPGTAPGGVYKLKPGIYVAKGSSCGSPANAAIREYDGRGISTANTHACRARILARKGNSYTVSQSCIDAGAGPAPRREQRQQIRVYDALTFGQAIGGNITTYRYCPVRQLPAGIRPRAG
ncbi:hypothetical protein ACG3SL_03835 [Sphingomonas sp. CJ20]